MYVDLSLAALKAQVEAFDVKVGVLIKNSDATGLSELFTEDCSMMPPGRDAVKGRQGTYIQSCLIL